MIRNINAENGMLVFEVKTDDECTPDMGDVDLHIEPPAREAAQAVARADAAKRSGLYQQVMDADEPQDGPEVDPTCPGCGGEGVRFKNTPWFNCPYKAETCRVKQFHG